MFVCINCYDPKHDKIKHSLQSYGRCEICGFTKVCWDVDIHYKAKDIKQLIKPEKVVFT